MADSTMPPSSMSPDMNFTSALADINSTDYPYYYHGTGVVVTMNMILAVTMVLAICGNIMVIMTILRRKSMRTRTNMFIINLAIADILVAIFDMPVSMITLANGTWVFGEAFCEFNGVTMALFLVASIHTLMYISVHKYISITRPFSRFMTPPRIIIMIAATWIWSASYAIAAAAGWNSSIYKNGTTQCGPRIPDDIVTRSHSLTNTIFNFAIPLSVMLFCYIGIFREIRGHMARMRQTTNLDANNSIAQQKRISVTLIMVVVCFLCCWTPYILYSTTLSLVKNRVPLISNAVAYWCGYLNSACNPIIYAFRSPSFRQGYWEIMCGRQDKFYSQGSFSQRSPSFRRRTFTRSTRQTTFRKEATMHLSEISDDFRNGSVDARQMQPNMANTEAPWHKRIFTATINNGQQFTAVFHKRSTKRENDKEPQQDTVPQDCKPVKNPKSLRTRSPTATTLLTPLSPESDKHMNPPDFSINKQVETNTKPSQDTPSVTKDVKEPPTATSSRRANSDTNVSKGKTTAGFQCDSDEEMESLGRRRKVRRQPRHKTTPGMVPVDLVYQEHRKKRSRSTAADEEGENEMTVSFLNPAFTTVQKSNSWSHVNDKQHLDIPSSGASGNIESPTLGSTIKRSFRALFGSLSDNRHVQAPTRRRSMSDHEDDDDYNDTKSRAEC